MSCKRLIPVVLVVILSLVTGQSPGYSESDEKLLADNTEGSKTVDSVEKLAETATQPKTQQNVDNALQQKTDDSIDLAAEMTVLFETLFNGNLEESLTDTDTDTDTAVATATDEKEVVSELSPEPSIPDSNTTPDDMQIRRTGDVNPGYGQQLNAPRVQYDESPQDNPIDRYSPPTPLYSAQSGQIRNRAPSDDVPFLQLTQGGYQRPYQQRDPYDDERQRLVQESVPQQAERPNPGSDNAQTGRPQIVPQVTYTTSVSAPQYGFGPGPVLRHPFVTGGFMNANGIIPSNIQGPFLNPPQTGFGDFATNNFQPQFPAGNDIGGFPAFARHPNGLPFFQTSPRGLYQSTGLMFQNSPQFVQAQSANADAPRTFQPGFPGYTNFETVEDAARPDYAAYFGNPAPANSQFQIPPNFYATSPATRGSVFNNPPISLLSNYPRTDDGVVFPSRFLRYPISDGQSIPQRNTQQNEKRTSDSMDDEQRAKDEGQINESQNKEDPTSVPYGTRLQSQSEGQTQNDVYISYPIREAGYATEEGLPSQNTTGDKKEDNDALKRPTLPFFQVFSSRDPYRDAFNKLQQSSTINSNSNSTESGQYFRRPPLPFDYPQPPSQIFMAYPERSQDFSSFPSPATGVDTARSPFRDLSSLPEGNYRFFREQPDSSDSNEVPLCALPNNASMCFEDSEYPKREIIYAVNSDSFLLDRLALPTVQMEENFLDQNVTDDTKAEENYICKSDIKYGAPLRAKNVNGAWKIIVNVERSVAQGRFTQPLRFEVCRNSGDPCSYTDSRVKTTCVQKYSLQRLLSWSPDRGVHNDVYKFPVACSCQIFEAAKV